MTSMTMTTTAPALPMRASAAADEQCLTMQEWVQSQEPYASP